MRTPSAICAAFVCALVMPVAAQTAEPDPPRQDRPAAALPAGPVDDVIVVTASRREEQLTNAPATMTVVTSEIIGNAPIVSLTELLRAVPGVNTVQTSARDVNVTVRAATGT